MYDIWRVLLKLSKPFLEFPTISQMSPRIPRKIRCFQVFGRSLEISNNAPCKQNLESGRNGKNIIDIRPRWIVLLYKNSAKLSWIIDYLFLETHSRLQACESYTNRSTITYAFENDNKTCKHVMEKHTWYIKGEGEVKVLIFRWKLLKIWRKMIRIVVRCLFY